MNKQTHIKYNLETFKDDEGTYLHPNIKDKNKDLIGTILDRYIGNYTPIRNWTETAIYNISQLIRRV